MTAPGHEALRQLALNMLANRAGPAAGAEAVAAAADRAYHDLAQVLATVIGDMGVSALTDRAVHLAKDEYPWLIPPRESGYAEERFSQIIPALKEQHPAVVAGAAGAVFATLIRLLGRFIGEPLAARLLRQAWPDAFSSAKTEET